MPVEEVSDGLRAMVAVEAEGGLLLTVADVVRVGELAGAAAVIDDAVDGCFCIVPGCK